MNGVQMQDVAPGARHRLFDARCCPPMRQGQEQDKLAAQLGDLRIGQRDIAGQELGPHLTDAAAVFKQAPAYENQHIPGGVAPMGHPAAQGRVFKNTAAVFAALQDPAGDKDPRQADDPFDLCL